MFLSTLGWRSDNTVMEFVKAKRSSNIATVISPKLNRRGKHKRDDKPMDQIRTHIASYNPYVSHYRLKNSPQAIPRFGLMHDGLLCRKTTRESMAILQHPLKPTGKCLLVKILFFRNPLPMIARPAWSITYISKRLCTQLKKTHINAKYVPNFRYINRSIARPGESTRRTETWQRKVCFPFTQPTWRFFSSQNWRQKSKVFVSQLVVFNETFAALNENREHLLMLWHEAIAGRTAQDVAATYLKVIKVTGEQEYTFWVDYCRGQNKNWFL